MLACPPPWGRWREAPEGLPPGTAQNPSAGFADTFPKGEGLLGRELLQLLADLEPVGFGLGEVVGDLGAAAA